MELAIDTSTRFASVGLSRQGAAVAELTWWSAHNHSVELVPAVQAVMARAGARMADLEAVFLARGPGGFSALRVGMATAKALCMALCIPLVAVNTLDVEAEPHLGLGLPVWALLEAGRSKVYLGRYGERCETAGGGEYEVVDIDALASGVEGATIFCGEGATAVSEALRDELGNRALVVGTPPPTRRALVLARLAFRRWQEVGPDELGGLQPMYMRGSQFDVARGS